ncbi:hypothetical protein SGL43_06028 [Streptomyces globisporus]|uniref:Uncharacterized protein n=1 Tax=Streptomyces globisporus TaxID=1908 RepID=A0ABM9H5Q1_STRGL|nr:hypothetical protein SGL43_06028 [Streptomyces globisporus]
MRCDIHIRSVRLERLTLGCSSQPPVNTSSIQGHIHMKPCNACHSAERDDVR